ncbi:MAG: bifunctional (p)ppGpp synthetase/guanosine-3',5'-bis(diphosphate) 3'-pyrophosphohydrolase [Oscillospiraceae bacterium]|nr:bifunctional (p)ppGpp synthetase/guanosine-3',5'-bis(diphosphate) 3'-pyrophosphohydrolase [Oscillospiraceae bacterium]
MYTYEQMIEQLESSPKQYDINKIIKAYNLAEVAHAGQMRESGEPYISHPMAVMEILLDLGMDTESLIAALLHDVVEDTNITLDDIKKNFGDEVALLVDGVTKLSKMTYSSKEEQQAENVRKMLLAMAKDVRVIIIKLADRLHNMRTMGYKKNEDKRREKARETMEVYAPLAHRLGIRAIKEELEDISLRFLDPIGYHEIERMLEMKKEDRENFLNRIKEQIQQRLAQESMEVHLAGRVKSIYGIYRKVFVQGREFDEIYDVYAVRLIVNNMQECYNLLGIAHDMFTPIPNRFNDYISTPKNNMYQSLHTTVVNKDAIPFEIQIRTWDMHYTAEYGIAAHWKYKAGVTKKDKLDERLSWVRQLLEAQQISDDAEDIVRTIKSDIAPEEVFVFTPQGDVISLPTGATVLDFAYAIHSAVGNRTVGAKVDGRMVSLDFKVKTGNIVEILTAKGHGPSRDWLNIVTTGEAKTKIRSWFKKERREENIVEGRQQVEREMRRNLMNVDDADLEQFLMGVAKKQNTPTLDDFYAAVGYGGISLSKLLPRMKEAYKAYRVVEEDPVEKTLAANKPKKERKASGGVVVEGLDSCLVKFAKCCNPLPGDDIIGFVTRGYGVSIHKKDCVNVENSPEDQKNRWVNAEWAKNFREKFQSTIDIKSENRTGLLADVSILLSNMHIPIHSVMAKELKEGYTIIQITVEVADLGQLTHLLNALGGVKGVFSVQRSLQ